MKLFGVLLACFHHPFPRGLLCCRPRTGDSRFDRDQAELLRAMLESSIQVRPCLCLAASGAWRPVHLRDPLQARRSSAAQDVRQQWFLGAQVLTQIAVA